MLTIHCDIIELSDSETETECSQATLPPSPQQSQVFEISDDELPTAPLTPSPSAQLLDLSDDDDDDISISSPQKVLPRGSVNKGKARAFPGYDLQLDSGSDSDLPDANELLNDLLPRTRSYPSSRTVYSSKRSSSQTSTSADSDETSSLPKKTPANTLDAVKQQTKRGKTVEGKAREKDYERDTQKAERARQKQLKDDEKSAQKRAQKAQKEVDKAQKQRDKEDKALHRTVNQLLLNKKEALQYMTLILSKSFRKSYPDFARLLHAKLDGHKAGIRDDGPDLLPGYDTVRWQRLVFKEYDISVRAFKAVKPPYQKFEKFALMRLSIVQLRNLVQKNGLVDLVQDFRQAHGLGRKDHMYIMISGMRKLRARNAAEWKKLEGALTSLQFQENVYLACVENEQEAVDRLYNYSGDLGIREDKLISRSYLPFCPDTKVKVGKDPKDTWTKMLSQIHRVTDSGAEGIVEQYPTMRSLLIAYEKNPLGGEGLLTKSKVNYRIDGQKTIEGRGHDKLGLALSRRVHTILSGTDDLALVVKDK
ncbi:hypothetical protein EV368DRAFT_80104 [Lentinula lateritia]|uniref:Uncharacterized protein n=1 Tax=Lentinula aff. lateritia TaxID=2804960 RepID=A0ACC1U2V9_9AGAR|nr:hypothetical protein F5876DRAFT_76088 [Lentinula aff. lateritia]KAJ3854963.1 hypothetical protein EV368DRAFT_80104 [Lentinula lateritia]